MTARIACGSDRAILHDVLTSLSDGSPCIVPPPSGILGVTEIAERLHARQLVLYTSGSTGPSRGIRRTHQSWIASFAPLTELMGLTSDDAVWIPGPLTSTLFLYGALHAAHEGFDVLLSDMPGASATVAHTVPAIAMEILEHAEEFPRLRMLVVAGDRLPPGLWECAQQAGVELLEYYGAAELSFVATRSRGDVALRAFPRVDIEVRESTVWVRSPYLASGYEFADDEGAPGPASWCDGWASVGDLGRLEGDHLEVIGRGDSAVTVGGHTVVTDDVEYVLRRTLGISDIAVTGVGHPRFGEVLVAVIAGDVSDSALRLAADELPGPARPRRWIRADALPRTAAGKIDRPAVRRIAESV